MNQDTTKAIEKFLKYIILQLEKHNDLTNEKCIEWRKNHLKNVNHNSTIYLEQLCDTKIELSTIPKILTKINTLKPNNEQLLKIFQLIPNSKCSTFTKESILRIQKHQQPTSKNNTPLNQPTRKSLSQPLSNIQILQQQQPTPKNTTPINQSSRKSLSQLTSNIPTLKNQQQPKITPISKTKPPSPKSPQKLNPRISFTQQPKTIKNPNPIILIQPPTNSPILPTDHNTNHNNDDESFESFVSTQSDISTLDLNISLDTSIPIVKPILTIKQVKKSLKKPA